MPYPRQLVLDEDTKNALVSYLNTELDNHYLERGTWIDDLIQWQKEYWAKPTIKQATFPFTGASTIIIPLTAISVEAVHARTMTTLFGIEQIVSSKDKTSLLADYARPYELFMNHQLLNVMQFKEKTNDAVLEVIKLGTGCMKSGYERVVRTAVRTIGDTEQEFEVVTKDGATVDTVPISQFLMPFYARGIENAPWVGEEHSETGYTIQSMERSGLFYAGTYDKIKSFLEQAAIENEARKYERSQQTLEDKVPTQPKLIDWVELWCCYDIDKSGYDKELVIHYHRASNTLMSVRYNWRADLSKPYHLGVYFPVEHRWAGIGVAKQTEQFQKEITTQHRQRLDNATLANIRMFKVSKLTGYGPNEPIFPGKMWFLDNMDHIDSIQMGEIYPSAYNNESGTLMFSQQRTGVNEVTLGMPQVGTPGTATSDLSRIQEGNKKFDYHFSNIKTFLNHVITDVELNIQQFGPRDIDYYNIVDGGQYVMDYFSKASPEQIRNHTLIDLKLVGSQRNEIVDRQNWIQLFPMINQYYQGLLLLSQGNPQLYSAIVQQALKASTEVIKQILETYEVHNIDRILIPNLLQPGMPNVGSIVPTPNGPVGAGLLATQLVSGANNGPS